MVTKTVNFFIEDSNKILRVCPDSFRYVMLSVIKTYVVIP
jgi:hypothetical protein